MKVNDVLRARGLGVGSKLTGDAVSSDVRSGKKFMNKDGESTGTLPVQSAIAQSISPGTLNIVKPAGIYDGEIVIEGATTLQKGNIRSGVTIFGVTGKSAVVDTTESAYPVDALEMVEGKVAFVNGTKITGNLPIQSTGTPFNITPGTQDIIQPMGVYYAQSTIKGDSDLIAAHIKEGVNIFGVAGTIKKGTIGNTVIYSDQIQAGTASAVDTKLKEVRVSEAGSFRVKFSSRNDFAGNDFFVAVYVNGVKRSPSILNNGGGSTTNIDLTINANDLVQMYARSAAGTMGYITNFQICTGDYVFTPLLT